MKKNTEFILAGYATPTTVNRSGCVTSYGLSDLDDPVMVKTQTGNECRSDQQSLAMFMNFKSKDKKSFLYHLSLL